MKKLERIYHTWDKWECYRAGFYETRPPKGMTDEEAEEKYRELLSDPERFRSILRRVIKEWKNSCEHYLTNVNMNRIAWMGQSALAYELGIPSKYRGGYNLLSEEQQKAADMVALDVINEWMELNGFEVLTMETISPKTQANLY